MERERVTKLEQLMNLPVRDLLVKLGEQVERDLSKHAEPFVVNSRLGAKTTSLKQPESGQVLSAAMWLASQRGALLRTVNSALEPLDRKIVAAGSPTPEVISKISSTLASKYRHYDPDVLATCALKLGLKDLIGGVDSEKLEGYDKALLLDMFGQHEEAIPVYGEWLEHHSKDPFALNNLAYDYALLNRNIDEAAQMAKQAESCVTDDQEKASVLDTLAFILVRKGEFEEAKSLLDESLRLRADKPPHPEHLFRYSLVLEKLGETERAFEYLSRAYRFFANDEVLDIAGDESLAYFVMEEGVISDILNKWNGETARIYELTKYIEDTLRATVHEEPTRESEILDQVGTLLLARDYGYQREYVHIPYSGKRYVPDFVLPELNACLEVKLSKKKGDSKRIIAEINDDIAAYRTGYKFVLFVVYDIGTIADSSQWKKDFVSDPRVWVILIKH